MYITSNQGVNYKSVASKSSSQTLAQIKSLRNIKSPTYENGNLPVIDNTIFAANCTGVNADLFLYKGKVSWGEVINLPPLHHFIVEGHGGVDCVEINNEFSVAFELFYPRQSKARVNRVVVNPVKFPLQGYGTYMVTVSNRNVEMISQINPVRDQEPNTFYFQFKSNDTSFDWKLTLYLDDTPCRIITSTEYKQNDPIWVDSQEDLGNNFPTAMIIIKLVDEFTMFLVKDSNIPLKTEQLVDSKRSTWVEYGKKVYLVPGEIWVGSLENKTNNTCLISVEDAKDILYVEPQSEKEPVTLGYSN